MEIIIGVFALGTIIITSALCKAAGRAEELRETMENKIDIKK